ncbi:TPA: LysR family transcriptional regulator [Serratia fonticola]|nr:LysR family transcriptional regulator [Serratia fonticola]
MKNLPKPNQLKVFQSIIEHGSFRAAAKALHQTQPALTQSMNELNLSKSHSLPLLLLWWHTEIIPWPRVPR